jgi:hypothetical protein
MVNVSVISNVSTLRRQRRRWFCETPAVSTKLAKGKLPAQLATMVATACHVTSGFSPLLLVQDVSSGRYLHNRTLTYHRLCKGYQQAACVGFGPARLNAILHDMLVSEADIALCLLAARFLSMIYIVSDWLFGVIQRETCQLPCRPYP